MESEVISWDTHEYYHMDRGSDWFWMLGIVSVSLAIICVLFGNVLLALFILIAAFAAGLYAAKGPNIAHFELQPKGILAGETFYTFKTLESFWIDEHHPLPRIILKSKKTFMPHILIPIDDMPVHEIREYLLDHIHEVEHQESIAHQLLERLGL
jgi:hypothetical protein